MAEKMLIDASHPEETRVVVVRGNRIEEFDFESQHKKQLRGNIYLAKVTRVEPSLQAAFVDYGGNRHGFLAFSEIHPDYYQIPLADRQALLEEEAAEAIKDSEDQNEAEESENLEAEADTDADSEEKPKPKKRTRRRRSSKSKTAKTDDAENASDANADGEASPEVNSETDIDASTQDAAEQPSNSAESEGDGEAVEAKPDAASDEASAETGNDDENGKPDTIAAIVETEDEISEPVDEDRGEQDSDDAQASETADDATSETVTDTKAETEGEEAPAAESEAETDAKADPAPKKKPAKRKRRSKKSDTAEKEADAETDDENVEQVGAEDALEELPEPVRKSRKQYKIQEVIKRRQILLVQIVKEERGNKGAALTTYMSLAGRYSVLMPNTARGGGISRKITNVQDRKRLKEIARELEVPQGMGVILRTAGASRTKTEIRRDFEYLMRLWENVRNLTLSSTAPCLVYEEGSLIKRSVRDLYNKDINEVIVAGEAGYREAKDFMKMLMPSHAKVVQPYTGARPIFTNNGIENQLDQMLSPQVTLKSGGYLIINQTEALVAVDVNSGRSTRESSIEDTALQTNLEAAEEVARQLRLRDLAGLVVIDFIDMEEKRNNRAVEKRIKDCLKNDRARIQVGRISHFGLLEMSRQRIRASVLESTTQTCPLCDGNGHIRSDSSLALHILRGVEEQLLKAPRNNVNVRTGAEHALYLLNNKRDTLTELELRFGVTIMINADHSIAGQNFIVEKGSVATKPAMIEPDQLASSYGASDENMLDEQTDTPPSVDDDDNEQPRKRRRRRRRRGRGNSSEDQDNHNSENAELSDNDGVNADADEASSDDESQNNENDDASDEDRPKKRRRRGKRGGRKNREREAAQEQENSDSSGDASEVQSDPEAEQANVEVAASNEDATADDTVKADAEEKPKKPRRRRTSKAKSDDDAGQSSSSSEKAPETASAAEVLETAIDEAESPAKANRETRTNLDAIASEPVVTSSGSEPEAGSKKTGWWRRTFNS